MKQALAGLQNDRESNWNLMDKQLSLLHDNFNLLKKPIETLSENQDKITAYLNVVGNTTKELVTRHNQQAVRINLLQPFNSRMGVLQSNIDVLNNGLTDFTLILSDLLKHKLPVLLLPRKTIETIYRNLTQEAYLNTQFLQPELLYELSNVQWTKIGNELYLFISHE